MKISIRDAASAPTIPGGIQINCKRLWQFQEKIAIGHKLDDHEEQQGWMMTKG